MKITTRSVSPKPRASRDSQKGAVRRNPVRYFRKTEIFCGTFFIVFILTSGYFFMEKQTQTKNIIDLGVVQSVGAPDWSTGTVTVTTTKTVFEGRPYFKLSAGQPLAVKEYYSGEYLLCTDDGLKRCSSLSKDDAKKIIISRK